MYVYTQQNLLKDPTEVWKFTVDTEATEAGEKTTGIPLNLYGQNNVIVEVDWGDGTTSMLTSADYTSSDSRASVHEYETAGVYQIKMISHCWNALKLLTMTYVISSLKDNISSLYWWRRTLISVNSVIPYFYTKNYYRSPEYNSIETAESSSKLSGLFFGCANLNSIPEELFINNISAIDFSHTFSHCSSLQRINSKLFSKHINATNFSNCFQYCYALQAIPNGLFDNNTKATNFYFCFNRCSSIEYIPENLFDYNVDITDLTGCFSGCSSLFYIPENLFEYNTKVINICMSADNSYSHLFSYCTSLISIPENLFKSFDKVTHFRRCFENCTSLQSIPSGLFDNNTAVTSFGSCFSGCTSLQSIPSGLFDNNTAVTSFSSCFYQCSSLTDFTLHIGSSLVSSCNTFVPKKAGTTRTIYVPANYTTYTTFSNQATTIGLTIETVS